MNIIEVQQLNRVYGEVVKTHALKDATFTIKKGEFIAIMGPSGSGKSTLMHILGLLDRATDGTYLFDGQDVATLSEKELAALRNEKIGFVFQAFNLLPRTTVLKNVILPLTYAKNKAEKVQRATDILERIGLGHRLTNFTNQISGGEKQRVAIARALINKPSVIFADEPTGNLDSKTGVQVMEFFQQLNEEGHTIILVTHETKTAEHANRIIEIVDGEIVNDRAVTHRRSAKNETSLK